MIIIDCSIVMAFTLSDENSQYANDVIENLSQSEFKAIVPAIFYLECSNVLIMAHRRKRISEDSLIDYLDTLELLPLEVDEFAAQPDTMVKIARLANEYDLTTYDAAYLELALRKDANLATLDKQLHRAAKAKGLMYAPKR